MKSITSDFAQIRQEPLQRAKGKEKMHTRGSKRMYRNRGVRVTIRKHMDTISYKMVVKQAI